jgi:acetyltransferase-like isoleucine patch superfamily enzyme
MVNLLQYLFSKLHKKLRQAMHKKYHRVLPMQELLTDRWEKASYLGFGKQSSIYDSALVFGKVNVGEHTWIGPHTILDGTGGLTIGSYCSISAGVQIYTHDTVQWAVSGGKEPYEYQATTIGDRCYIGPNVIIVKGVTLGSGTIVGANSFVNQSFGEGVKIAGNPARIIA